MISLTVPGRPPNLANARLHWAQRHRIVAERKQLVKLIAQSARVRSGEPKTIEPKRALATVYVSGRFRDPDNLVASLKADLDGLVDAGVLRNDDSTSVDLEVQQRRSLFANQQRVLWEIV